MGGEGSRIFYPTDDASRSGSSASATIPMDKAPFATQDRGVVSEMLEIFGSVLIRLSEDVDPDIFVQENKEGSRRAAALKS